MAFFFSLEGIAKRDIVTSKLLYLYLFEKKKTKPPSYITKKCSEKQS